MMGGAHVHMQMGEEEREEGRMVGGAHVHAGGVGG